MDTAASILWTRFCVIHPRNKEHPKYFERQEGYLRLRLQHYSGPKSWPPLSECDGRKSSCQSGCGFGEIQLVGSQYLDSVAVII